MDPLRYELLMALLWFALPLLVGCSGWIIWYLVRDPEARPAAVEMTTSELQALIDAEVADARAPLERRVAELESRGSELALPEPDEFEAAPAPARAARRESRPGGRR